MGSELAERIGEAAEFLRGRGVDRPRAAVVLGSGLSSVLELEGGPSLPFEAIPGFPRGALAGHDRRVQFGRAGPCPVLVLRGRAHYYEGVGLAEATFPVRVARALGARWIALVNSAGGLDPAYGVGDLVLIEDHINWMGDNPLIGPNDDSLGPRFPDLSRAYDPELMARAEEAARAEGFAVRRGVYAAVAGPHYETRAELRMLRALGADLVGMSTVPETIVAVHAGLRVLGVSVVTDRAADGGAGPLTHEEVLRAAARAAPRLDALLRAVLRKEDA